MKLLFILRVFKTSIGRKQLMAITGLLLSLFMLIHLAENLLLFKGEEWYNGWVNILITNPLTIYLEIGLLITFIIHIFMGMWVRYENWINSKVRKYETINWQGGRTIGSATMLYTAIILLIYIIFHLLHFKFTDHSMGFYQMVTSAFRNKTFVLIYITGSIALALHLSHGFQSAFQTLGINHEKYNIFIKIASYLVALMMVGFAMISLYYFFGFDIKADIEYNNLVEMTIE
ncbi:MAG: succinate dehydrogenase cytochrome b subunit [Elusimicrobiales bacterium]|nr:succinate dehydrogenase cytochrome b subunit [Elusimicrobiales bacterium]